MFSLLASSVISFVLFPGIVSAVSCRYVSSSFVGWCELLPHPGFCCREISGKMISRAPFSEASVARARAH